MAEKDSSAVDLSDKTFKTAQQVSDLSGKLMTMLRQFESVIEKGTGAGISFVGVDFSGTDLKFCTGDDIASACQTVNDLMTWLEGSFRDDVLDKVSPA